MGQKPPLNLESTQTPGDGVHADAGGDPGRFGGAARTPDAQQLGDLPRAGLAAAGAGFPADRSRGGEERLLQEDEQVGGVKTFKIQSLIMR